MKKFKEAVCANGFPPLHYSLSRKALKAARDCAELRNTIFDKISDPLIPAEIPPVPTTSKVDFESHKSIENDIMDALKNPSVYSIGIWGIGGVGKTVMAKKIEEKVGNEKTLFEHVVMVVVSQQPDLPKLQSEIAEALGLPLEEKSLYLRGKKLYNKPMAEKSILIILDDLWERLDLESLGIPSQSKHARCKLILTSRNEDALISTGVQNIFQLKILNEEESWRFFRDNVGINPDDDDSHNELLVQIAKKVARECNGLPLALKIIASALKGKDISFWNNTFRELHKSVPDNIPGVSKDVYGPLLYSINALEGKEQKDLFLLCCLFPEDYSISIEELFRCGIGLRIFKEFENLTEVREKVKSLLRILLSRSLLIIKGNMLYDNFCVRMHDVVRDVGIRIITKEGMDGSNKEKHLFMISHRLNGWPLTEEDSSNINNYTFISLLISHPSITFPKSIVHPKLEFLHLDVVQSFPKVELPENFFNGMGELKVIEASSFGFGFLPPSIGELNSLRTLSLQNCKICQTVSMLGKLINLEILSLEMCDFEMLPKEIGRLKNLKQLKILDCGGLRRIAFGVISELTRLEELVIFGSFKNWKAKARLGGDEDCIACLHELDSLKKLTTLKIEIKNPRVIPREKPLWVQNLKNYDIAVSISSPSTTAFKKSIMLGKKVVKPLGNWVYDMASDAEYLNLQGSNCMNVMEWSSQNSGNLRCLKDLRLAKFTNIQYLVEGQQKGAVFPRLKYLDISDSDSLQQISDVSSTIGSFVALEDINFNNLSRLTCLWKVSVKEQFCLKNLQSIDIIGCHNLSYMFSLSIALSLVQLYSLDVEYCETIKEIFKKDDGELVEKIKLPNLGSPSFQNLKSLCDFCNGIDRIELPKWIHLTLCNLPNMKMTKGDNEVHQRNLIPQVAGMNNFCGLSNLTVEAVGNFKCMFSPSIISGIPNLQRLVVKNCSMLEQVIGKDDENIGETISFPNLWSIVLGDLPNILTFCYNIIQLPLLDVLDIWKCPKMLKFVEEFPNHIFNSTSLLDEQVHCPRLNSLWLDELNISSVFSPHTFKTLTHLTSLRITCCEELEHIIMKEEEGETISFPNLWSIHLRGLPNILTFCYNAIQLPSLTVLEIFDCPKMLKFVEELPNHISNSTSLLEEQVYCPKLKALNLHRLSISSVFSPHTFKTLTRLTSLNVAKCDELEHIIIKEGEGETTCEEFRESVPLCLLRLKNLPKLHGSVFEMKRPLEFLSLADISIRDCPMLEKFSLGSVHMPKLKIISSLEICSEKNYFIIPSKDIFFSSHPNDIMLDFLPIGSSQSFANVVLLFANVFFAPSATIVGKFKTERIQKGIEYDIMLIIAFGKDPIDDGGLRKNAIEIELKIPGESKLQQRTEILNNQPREIWTELSIGKFILREHQQISEELEFSLRYLHLSPTLWVKGVRIVEA